MRYLSHLSRRLLAKIERGLTQFSVPHFIALNNNLQFFFFFFFLNFCIMAYVIFTLGKFVAAA